MRRVLTNAYLCFPLAVLLLILVVASSVSELWIISILAFIAALIAIGWHKAPPVLVWMIAINMLSIWADIATIEIYNAGWDYGVIVYTFPDAIIQSSCAMIFLSIGIRGGLIIGGSMFRYRLSTPNDQMGTAAPYSVHRIALAYILVQPVTALLGIIGQAVPGLAQPTYAFSLLKFTLIYMLAAKIFATGRHFLLLTVVIVAEIVIGSTGFWASYKEGFFIVLIALAANSRSFTRKQAVLAFTGVAVVLYISIAWTAVKKEYRADIVANGPWASFVWLAEKYTSAEFDFTTATVDLLSRVGYTKYYAMVMTANTDAEEGIYKRALLHIVTPRLFFPDKAILDDSAQTTRVLGLRIDSKTSIGLGYVAQAYIDFGFPGLLIPMVVLGMIVGSIYTYFVTRRAPQLIREGFAVACLFNSLAFAGNIDKEFGGLITAFLVLALTLRYGAAILHRQLENKPRNTQVRHVGQADFAP